MLKWIKVACVGVPVIVASTIYAFASTTSPSTTSASKTTNSTGNVTITVGPTNYVSDGSSQTQTNVVGNTVNQSSGQQASVSGTSTSKPARPHHGHHHGNEGDKVKHGDHHGGDK